MIARLLHHWPAKLGSLLAAAVLWFCLRQAIRYHERPSAPPAPSAPVSVGRVP